MSGTDNNNSISWKIRVLLFLGLSIAVSVSVTVFLHMEQAAWCKEMITTHCRVLDVKLENLTDSIKEIKSDVKDIRKEVMSK